MDNSYVGRGNGKSAFALNVIDEINKEFCLDLSNESNKCFGLHISPEPSGRTKTFYSFTDLIFDTILDKGIIKYCLASLRLESILNIYEGLIDVEKEFENEADLISKLNNRLWLQEKGINIAKISNGFYKNKELGRVTANFPLNRERRNHFENRIVQEEDFKKYYYEILKKGKDRIDFVFNDMVLFFLASGFNGAYLIIDDFERIPDFQSEKLKQQFSLELRTNLFDGMLENAKIGFYNMILILHAGVPRLMQDAWAVSGMNRRSPMLLEDNVPSRHIINFDKLSVEFAKLLIERYLNQYRLKGQVENRLFPFSEKAIEVISEKAELNASSILEKAHMLIEEGINSSKAEIDESFVSEKLRTKEDVSSSEERNISNQTSEDLFQKSKKKY